MILKFDNYNDVASRAAAVDFSHPAARAEYHSIFSPHTMTVDLSGDSFDKITLSSPIVNPFAVLDGTVANLLGISRDTVDAILRSNLVLFDGSLVPTAKLPENRDTATPYIGTSAIAKLLSEKGIDPSPLLTPDVLIPSAVTETILDDELDFTDSEICNLAVSLWRHDRRARTLVLRDLPLLIRLNESRMIYERALRITEIIIEN